MQLFCNSALIVNCNSSRYISNSFHNWTNVKNMSDIYIHMHIKKYIYNIYTYVNTYIYLCVHTHIDMYYRNVYLHNVLYYKALLVSRWVTPCTWRRRVPLCTPYIRRICTHARLRRRIPCAMYKYAVEYLLLRTILDQIFALSQLNYDHAKPDICSYAITQEKKFAHMRLRKKRNLPIYGRTRLDLVRKCLK